ncbi:hypothetical protein R3P38DRAFT_3361857 [Favolaschia claudopus]|uniref:Uncharacterized protein n=1 Tax=Favolaschia claudopus TaxID=2862362 RepID=A0AAW0AT68_9AGAR
MSPSSAPSRILVSSFNAAPRRPSPSFQNPPRTASTLLKMQQRWSTIKLLCEPLAQILKHPSMPIQIQASHASSSLQVAMLEGTSSDKRNSSLCFNLATTYYYWSLLKAGGYSDWKSELTGLLSHPRVFEAVPR